MLLIRPVLAAAIALASPPALGLAQEKPPKPKKVKKDMFEVQCRFGAADSSHAPIAIRYGLDPADAAFRVRRSLKDAEVPIARDGMLFWTTSPIDRWPAGPRGDAWRAYAHPGVYASLVLAQNNGTVVLLGSVEALCATSPGAPDSTIAAAVSMYAEDLAGVLRRGSPNPDVPVVGD